MEIKVLNDELKNQACDALVVGLYQDSENLTGSIASVDEALGGLITDFVINKDKFEGKFNTTYLMQTYGKIPANKVLIVGLGKKDELTPSKLRTLMVKATRKLNSIYAKKVCVDFGKLELPVQASAEFVVEGAIIGEYSFDKYKTMAPKKVLIDELILVEKDSDKIEKLKAGAKKGELIANAMSDARDLANSPAEIITPTKLAEIAKKLDGIKTKIYEKDDIQDMGMGAFYAVSKGSAEFPKFIHMKYEVKNPVKKIALIGKGLTFDAGGMDIKTAAGMLTMKDDMSGAACIIAVMSILKELKPNVEVHGIVAACENMVSGSSYKPGDILKAKNGKTIEVDNTDAEGRLTLADALCYACDLDVDEIIDIATLTGACKVAFGTQCSGILGTDDEMLDKLIKIGSEQGEKFWKLPLFEEYFNNIKSDVADMKNTGGRSGGASTAGVFLKEFVKDSKKWAHMDVAGTAFLEAPQGELIKGSTGIGVRTLANYIISQ